MVSKDYEGCLRQRRIEILRRYSKKEAIHPEDKMFIIGMAAEGVLKYGYDPLKKEDAVEITPKGRKVLEYLLSRK